MKLKFAAHSELRRSAVLAGRAAAGPGQPELAADRLWLRARDGVRRYDSHVRPGGVFFFLDVAPGRYELVRSDAAGNVVQQHDVVLPARDAGAKLPLVRVDLPIPAPSPGRPHRKARLT